MTNSDSEFEKGSVEWLMAKFEELCKEARANGFDTAVIVRRLDRLDGSEEFAWSYEGGLTTALGMCERARIEFVKDSHKDPAN